MKEPERSLSKPKREKLDRDGYATFMRSIFDRDGWKCRNPFCNALNHLTVHHLQKRSQLGGDTNGNCITLCVQCHDAAERNELKIEVIDVAVKFYSKREKNSG